MKRGRAVLIVHALQGMEHEMEYPGRVNELLAPEVRQEKRAKDEEVWNKVQRMRKWGKGK